MFILANMLRLVVLALIVTVVVSSPPVVKSRQEIEAFRSLLEKKKTNDELLLTSGDNPGMSNGPLWSDFILDDWMIDHILTDYAGGRSWSTYPWQNVWPQPDHWPDIRWPNNTVVWEFKEMEFVPSQQATITDIITEIEERTCIKFRYREPHDTVYVSISGSLLSCFGQVGYWPSRGVHILNLARNARCFHRHPEMVHEFMHVLGFFHMNNVANRDDYVAVHLENAWFTAEVNLAVIGPQVLANLGVEYEYTSVMHDGDRIFSNNGQPTIVALKEFEGVMGLQNQVTENDWLRINRYYNCPESWD